MFFPFPITEDTGLQPLYQHLEEFNVPLGPVEFYASSCPPGWSAQYSSFQASMLQYQPPAESHLLFSPDDPTFFWISFCFKHKTQVNICPHQNEQPLFNRGSHMLFISHLDSRQITFNVSLLIKGAILLRGGIKIFKINNLFV